MAVWVVVFSRTNKLGGLIHGAQAFIKEGLETLVNLYSQRDLWQELLVLVQLETLVVVAEHEFPQLKS